VQVDVNYVEITCRLGISSETRQKKEEQPNEYAPPHEHERRLWHIENRVQATGFSILVNYRNQAMTVRREKALVHSGNKARPGTGSLHPVAIGAAAEVTKPSEPPV